MIVVNGGRIKADFSRIFINLHRNRVVVVIEEVFGYVEEVESIGDLPELNSIMEAPYFLHIMHVLLLSKMLSKHKGLIYFPGDPLVLELEFVSNWLFEGGDKLLGGEGVVI